MTYIHIFIKVSIAKLQLVIYPYGCDTIFKDLINRMTYGLIQFNHYINLKITQLSFDTGPAADIVHYALFLSQGPF